MMSPRVKVALCRAGARLPEYKTAGAAGADLYLPEFHNVALLHGESAVVPLGFKMELPEGFEAQVRSRSSIAKAGILVSFGTVDSDYRGEACVHLTRLWHPPIDGLPRHVHDVVTWKPKAGERIAQLVIAPVLRASFELVAELSETVRGEGGYGSTGK